MNYPRVNLLKKSEQRYQGKVSRKFILIAGVGAFVLTVLLIVGLFLVHKASLRNELNSTRVLWAQMEPRMKEHARDNKELATVTQILDLFHGWEGSRAPFVKLLNDVQSVVPETVQFTRMSVQTGAVKPIYKTSEELQLDYNLIIEGVAIGSQAEKQVILLQKGLLACEQIGNTFGALKLASLKPHTSEAGENSCDFRLVGENAEGAK
jgi:Tfp pilus assembly protein PilN